MGQTILTARQFNFLEHIQSEQEIIRWYYLTGGTALSEYYLHHRLSEDIDLFSTSEVNDGETDKIININPSNTLVCANFHFALVRTNPDSKKRTGAANLIQPK